VIIAHPGGEAPGSTGPKEACSVDLRPLVHHTATATAVPQPTTPPMIGSGWDAVPRPELGAPSLPAAADTIRPDHWAELVASAIAPDVAALNVASFGPATPRHWEDERAELVAHDRQRIESGVTSGKDRNGRYRQSLTGQLWHLDRRYRHLQAGGWRSLSDALPGLPAFDQWKPCQARERHDKPGRLIKYEAPPGFPDGGGVLLPRVPVRCWRLICQRQGLPFPDKDTRRAGFWAWALATPGLRLLICEGWKKALAAISAGWAALALPGVQMGRRVEVDSSERLIPALQALAAAGRPWLIAFDAEAKPSTAAKVGAAAGALARTLRAAGGLVQIARLPLLPATEKTGLDDLLAAAGPEALDRALANTGPRPVLPWLREADRVAPTGQWLGEAGPLPSPDVAPLVVIQAPMGCGKTTAIRAAVRELEGEGVQILAPYHRRALGQAGSDPKRGLGVPWCPAPGSEERRLGVAACWDSWCPESPLQINGDTGSGGVMVLDEWAQALEHLLLSHGTALGKGRRAAALRTLAEQARRLRQTIAADAQLPDWAVRLLESLTGHRAYVIRSDHQPMAGRPLYAPEGFTTAAAAAKAFRVRWAELVDAGEPFLCWTSAQQCGKKNAPQTLAKRHRKKRPADLVDVIDSKTPELAAELAADPNGFAERRTAQARERGGSWALYCSPAISSGLSFSWDAEKRQGWRPAAVIAFAGGRIAPEHVAQALARVRCPEVPSYVFAPEVCPGAALRVGSGSTDPAELIRHLRAVSDPLLGELPDGDDRGAFLQAWAELGAHRNRQRFAYRATIAGLLQREGWALQAPGPAHCPQTADAITAELQAIAEEAQAAEDAAVIAAPPLTALEAVELNRRRRSLDASEEAALARFELAKRWGLGAAAPSLELLQADRDGLADRLRLGWILTTPEALALVPEHDWQQIAALDPAGRPFEPDRLRVTLASRVVALQSLGVPGLLQRFAAGETIAATDPAIVALHATATACRGQLAAAAGVSPAKLPTGTLRALLQAIGWRLERVGRNHSRTQGQRGAYLYKAQRQALPEGVDPQALAAVWLEGLRNPVRSTGAKNAPTGIFYRGEKSASAPHPPPRLASVLWSRVAVPSIPWFPCQAPPPRSRPAGFRPDHPAEVT
jgi:hypothetical protein